MSLAKRLFIPLVVMLVLFLQLAAPSPALADEGQPPEVTETEVPVDPGGGSGDGSGEPAAPPEPAAADPAPADPAPADPVADEALAADEPAAPPDPAADDAPSEPAPDEPAEPVTDEPLTVPEILEQAPPDTQIAVVNGQGELEPLATQEAGEIIANSDPVWCPTGQTPGGAGCTPNQTSVTDLINLLDVDNGATYSGGGTIFFEDGAYGGTETSLSFSSATLNALGSLGLEGGWNLVTNTKVVGGSTTFSAPIVVTWASSVTLNDLSVNTAAGTSAVTVTTTGDVTLDTVSAANTGGTNHNGATLDSGGNVNVTDSTFSGSTAYGLYADADGAIDLDNVSAGANDNGGAVLNNYLGTGNVQVTDSDFDGNGGTGLEINSAGDVEVATTQANGNTGAFTYGAAIDNTAGTGAVTVTDSSFNNNGLEGLFVSSHGSVSLGGTIGNTASGNLYGAYVETSGASTITIDNSAFSSNARNGLVAVSADGTITLSGVTAGTNDPGDSFFGSGCEPMQFDGGIWLVSETGNVTVGLAGQGVSIAGNNGVGLKVETGGNILLTQADASDNGSYGAFLSTGGGDISVDIGTFNQNGEVGLKAMTGGVITLNSVTANSNGFAGAWVKSWDGTTNPAISVINSTFDGNESYGLKVFGSGYADINTITATNNGNSGIYIDYLAPCGQPGGIHVDVNLGSIQLNGVFGIQANIGPTGSLVVAPATIYDPGNNGTPAAPANNLSQVAAIHPCPPPEEHDKDEDKDQEPPKPYNEVELPDDGGEPVFQDCELFGGLVMTLPNGDNSQVACPAEGSFLVEHLAEDELPGELPPGPEFLSALTVSGTDADGNPIEVLPPGAAMLVSFDIPEGMENARFAILFWDEAANEGAGDWVELPREQLGMGPLPLHPDTPEDNMLILRGVREDEGKVTVKVNFTGTFVLIAK